MTLMCQECGEPVMVCPGDDEHEQTGGTCPGWVHVAGPANHEADPQ